MPSGNRISLPRAAYAGPEKLAARRKLWSYSDRSWSSSRAALAHPLVGSETVVDVGCGDGYALRGLRANGHRGILIGVDLSPGMLAGIAPQLAIRLVADAQALPLDTGVTDIMLAMHMLYHVPDIPRALREAARVLRREGTFVASTNSEQSLRELREQWSAAMVRAGAPPLRRPHTTFSCENGGDLLATVFSSVEMKSIEMTARLPAANVARDYVASLDDLYRSSLPDPESWHDILDSVEAHAQCQIDEHGIFTVTQQSGIFICKP